MIVLGLSLVICFISQGECIYLLVISLYITMIVLGLSLLLITYWLLVCI